MFGSSKRNVFKPTAYGTTRRSRRVPRWLMLMLTGVVLGSGGLLFLQKSYGPTRLTVEQSEQLHYELNSVKMDKQRLQTQVNQQARELTDARSKLESQSSEVQEARAFVDKAKKDLQLFIDAMPADPRGTSPGIRAASFRDGNGQLEYEILVMQDEGKTKLFSGEVALVVAGRYTNGKNANIDLPPFGIELERYTYTQGHAPLPDGFSPRQVTIKITREGSNKQVATRTLRVAR